MTLKGLRRRQMQCGRNPQKASTVIQVSLNRIAKMIMQNSHPTARLILMNPEKVESWHEKV